ncbi:hypothetical protein SLEP1_g8875 [Rubroshorea leprosula]|uniref:Uncharacterized protein n=1 Tax=Rubroshorea leprosula TaxID=152421 RepID=A0AAV5ICX0_9ROSI|nr:hypothetical protein SLEP1_g8875 [Rubroshorea leprosula]
MSPPIASTLRLYSGHTLFSLPTVPESSTWWWRWRSSSFDNSSNCPIMQYS